MILPSGVRTILFLTVSGGGMSVGGCGAGRSMSTEWVATGMVMMNMMSRTSMTSMSGVVFISIIGEPSSLPPDIAMGKYSWNIARALGSGGIHGVRDEAHGRIA